MKLSPIHNAKVTVRVGQGRDRTKLTIDLSKLGRTVGGITTKIERATAGPNEKWTFFKISECMHAIIFNNREIDDAVKRILKEAEEKCTAELRADNDQSLAASERRSKNADQAYRDVMTTNRQFLNKYFSDVTKIDSEYSLCLRLSVPQKLFRAGCVQALETNSSVDMTVKGWAPMAKQYVAAADIAPPELKFDTLSVRMLEQMFSDEQFVARAEQIARSNPDLVRQASAGLKRVVASLKPSI